MHDLLRKRLEAGQTFRVKVIPKSPKTKIVGELGDGTLKIKLAAVPERGRANVALCAFLANETGRKFEVISGHTAPVKLVRAT